MLPGYEVHESQQGSAELRIQPEAKVGSGPLGGQPDLETLQRVGALAVEAKPLLKAAVDGFHALATPGQPPPPEPRPGVATVTLGRAEDHGAVGVLPVLRALLACNAPRGHIDRQRRGADMRQPRVRGLAHGKAGRGPALSLSAGRPDAKTGEGPEGIDRKPHLKARVPAQPMAPANIGQSWQPALPPAVGLAGGGGGTVHGLIDTGLGLQARHQVPTAGDNGIGVLTQLPLALASIRQGGNRCPQLPLGSAIEAPLATNALPLARYRQGEHFASGQCGAYPRMPVGG